MLQDLEAYLLQLACMLTSFAIHTTECSGQSLSSTTKESHLISESELETGLDSEEKALEHMPEEDIKAGGESINFPLVNVGKGANTGDVI